MDEVGVILILDSCQGPRYALFVEDPLDIIRQRIEFGLGEKIDGPCDGLFGFAVVGIERIALSVLCPNHIREVKLPLEVPDITGQRKERFV